MAPEPYTLEPTRTARRQLELTLPEAVAAAAHEFITGPLVTNPHRVGKRLHEPLGEEYSARRGEFRILYRIDEDRRVVTIMTVTHRRDAYRS